MSLIGKPIQIGRKGHRRAEAATCALCWIVTDPPGEWMHGPLIEELKGVGFGHVTASSAIRELKDAGLVRVEITKRRSHRLFATVEGRACYFGLAIS